jgi:hypothetical protein
MCDNANENGNEKNTTSKISAMTQIRKEIKEDGNHQSQRAQPSQEQEHNLNWQRKRQPIACLHADRQ